MADDVEIKFGAETSGLKKGSEEATHSITRIREVLQGLIDPIRGVRNNLHELAEAFIAAFAIEKIKDFSEEMAEIGEQTERLSKIFGLSTEKVGELNFIGAATGTNDLVQGIERLQLNLARAATDGATPAAKALDALGISAKQLIGLPIDEQIRVLADSFSKWADGGNKVAVAMALGGRTFQDLIPLLDQGRNGVEELIEAFGRTGAALHNEVAERFEETKLHLVELNTAFTGLGERIFSVVQPAIDTLITDFTSLIEHINADQIRTAALAIVDDIDAITKVLADFALDIVDAFDTAIEKTDELGKKLALIAATTAGGALVGGPIGAAAGLAGGVAGALIGGGGGAVDDLDARIKKTNADIDAAMTSLKGLLSATGSTAGVSPAAPSGGGKPQLPNLDLGNQAAKDAKETLDAAMEGINAQIALAQKAYSNEVKLDELKVQGHQMTEQQKLAATQKALDAEYAAETALYQKELALEGLKPAEHQKILDKLHALDQEYGAKSAQLAQQAANAQMKSAMSALAPINSAINAQITPLITGAETIGQAFQKMAASVVESFVQMIAKVVEMKIEMAALSLIPGFQGIAASIGGFLQVPSFDVGNWNVASDTLAMVHQGETILPAGPAQAFRNAMSGGGSGGDGVHVHLNVSAMDSRDVTRLFTEHGPELANTVAHHVGHSVGLQRKMAGWTR